MLNNLLYLKYIYLLICKDYCLSIADLLMFLSHFNCSVSKFSWALFLKVPTCPPRKQLFFVAAEFINWPKLQPLLKFVSVATACYFLNGMELKKRKIYGWLLEFSIGKNQAIKNMPILLYVIAVVAKVMDLILCLALTVHAILKHFCMQNILLFPQ